MNFRKVPFVTDFTDIPEDFICIITHCFTVQKDCEINAFFLLFK